MFTDEERRILMDVLDTSQDGICIFDMNFAMIAANSAVKKWYERDEPLAGRKCHEIFRGKSLPCENCTIGETMDGGEAYRQFIQFAREDGGEGWLEVRAERYVNTASGEVKGFVTYLRDATEKLSLQQETVRSAQLASVGELAAGVAHEINNPINGIINYAQILANRLPPGENKSIAMRVIRDGDRISRIVRGLLSFTRHQRDTKHYVSMRDIIGEVLSLTGAYVRRDGIDLRIVIPDDLPDVHVIPYQVEQVFLNIINNARYALNERFPKSDERKILEIRCELCENAGRTCVRTDMCDFGVGIPEDLLEKVMTPFFTTKKGGEGTGLGLSISKNIILHHGGFFSIESREGEYTRVSIELPAGEMQ
ncbi:MAG: ATP-binding protein [Nitrospirota bacterium]|jgi:two-component system NtrC family sensor kinase